jgi:hypothetical protein
MMNITPATSAEAGVKQGAQLLSSDFLWLLATSSHPFPPGTHASESKQLT